MRKLALLSLLILLFPICTATVYINEFMPDPSGQDTAPKPDGEWIELYNNGREDVDLTGWRFYDANDKSFLPIGKDTASSTIIKSKGYLVVYRNGNKYFSMNNGQNGGDKITLKDSNREVVDSIEYTETEKGKTWSLLGDSWLLTNPTPGEKNEEIKDNIPIKNNEENDNRQGDTQNTANANSPEEDNQKKEEDTKEYDKKDENREFNKEESKKEERGSKITGKSIYVSPQKKSLTRPLLFLLAGLLIIVIALQIHIVSNR